MSKYQALIDALKAVTSTNWEHDGGADVFEVDVGVLVASTMETEDAAYIAEANPSTIRALMADLERAEKALAALAKQAQEPVDERAEFEASMREKHGWVARDFQSDSFGYFDGHTANAWLAWQARAALQSPAPQTKDQP